jgi:hypothetical protein
LQNRGHGQNDGQDCPELLELRTQCGTRTAPKAEEILIHICPFSTLVAAAGLAKRSTPKKTLG